jgi:transcriptional regulator with XRE-family HTH domain
MKLGQRLKQARQLAGMTQAEVAAQVHVTRGTISNWETGFSYPDIASLVLLSEYYHLSLDNLVRTDQKLMLSFRQQTQERQQAKWLARLTYLIDVMIIGLFGAQRLGLPGTAMGTTIEYGLLGILWLNLIVIYMTTRRARALWHKTEPLALHQHRIGTYVLSALILISGIVWGHWSLGIVGVLVIIFVGLIGLQTHQNKKDLQ